MSEILNASIRNLDTPARIKKLPISDTGYYVPWFVAWMNDGKACQPRHGKPDFRVVHPGRFQDAVNHRKCWICGEKLGKYLAFLIGPMCAVNRVTSEPPSHLECAQYAARACPFLTNPRMRRNEKDLPEDRVVPGIHIPRNPGVMCIWITKGYKPFQDGMGGYLLKLQMPNMMKWYSQGREATPDEIRESINSGLPILREAAKKDGSISELSKLVATAVILIGIEGIHAP